MAKVALLGRSRYSTGVIGYTFPDFKVCLTTKEGFSQYQAEELINLIPLNGTVNHFMALSDESDVCLADAQGYPSPIDPLNPHSSSYYWPKQLGSLPSLMRRNVIKTTSNGVYYAAHHDHDATYTGYKIVKLTQTGQPVWVNDTITTKMVSEGILPNQLSSRYCIVLVTSAYVHVLYQSPVATTLTHMRLDLNTGVMVDEFAVDLTALGRSSLTTVSNPHHLYTPTNQSVLLRSASGTDSTTMIELSVSTDTVQLSQSYVTTVNPTSDTTWQCFDMGNEYHFIRPEKHRIRRVTMVKTTGDVTGEETITPVILPYDEPPNPLSIIDSGIHYDGTSVFYAQNISDMNPWRVYKFDLASRIVTSVYDIPDSIPRAGGYGSLVVIDIPVYQITGSVTKNGQPFKNAVVSLIDASTGKRLHTATTDANGNYDLRMLDNSPKTVVIQQPGGKWHTRTGITPVQYTD